MVLHRPIECTAFYGNEWTQSTLGGLQRRAEQAMGNANRRAPNRGYIAVCNVAISLVKVDAVIVSKFPFHHDFAMNAVAEASAESEVVGAGLGNAEVIEKYASLDALLCKQARRTCGQQKSYNDGSELARHGVHLLTATI